MRSDEQLSRWFRDSTKWKLDLFQGERLSAYVKQPDGSTRITSLSGHERNVLFLNDQGKRFFDLSLNSGADNIADGRTFVIWDFDRDGWQDMALVNANSPLLSIYRNGIGNMAERGEGRMIALRFVGGNWTDRSRPEVACRDGYGAKVTVTLDGQVLLREHRCGEGFAGQNSTTMVIGIGNHAVARSVKVRWPAGQNQQIEDVPAGTLLTVYEDAERTTDRSGFTSEPYHRRGWQEQLVADREEDPSVELQFGNRTMSTASRLSIYTTMATWCDACKRQLSQLAVLRTRFAEEDLTMYGVPIDVSDDADKLDEYCRTYRPAYQLLADLNASDRRAIADVLKDSISQESLPSTVVTDRTGRVLKSFVGVPTISELRGLLQNQ